MVSEPTGTAVQAWGSSRPEEPRRKTRLCLPTPGSPMGLKRPNSIGTSGGPSRMARNQRSLWWSVVSATARRVRRAATCESVVCQRLAVFASSPAGFLAPCSGLLALLVPTGIQSPFPLRFSDRVSVEWCPCQVLGGPPGADPSPLLPWMLASWKKPAIQQFRKSKLAAHKSSQNWNSGGGP